MVGLSSRGGPRSWERWDKYFMSPPEDASGLRIRRQQRLKGCDRHTFGWRSGDIDYLFFSQEPGITEKTVWFKTWGMMAG